MQKHFGNFRDDQKGTVVVFFAAILLPILATVGMAVDYAIALNMKRELQTAADAGALAGASLVDATANEREQEVTRFLAANYPDNFDTSNITIDDEGVRVELSHTFPTVLMHLFGYDTMTPGVLSEALIPETVNTDLALVLDYSGSMNRGGKYQTMRDSAIDLIEDLEARSNGNRDRRLQIGLVPFSEYVYTDIATEYVRDIHSSYFGATVRACLDSRRYPFAVEASTPSSSQNDTRWPAPGMPDELKQSGGTLPRANDLNSTISADLCTPTSVRSGDDDDDDDDDDDHRAPIKSDYCQRTYSGAERSSQQSEIILSDFASVDSQCEYYRQRNVMVRPLTTDLAPLVSQLRSMRPIRLTNIALALEKGWHLVTQNAPYSEGRSPSDRVIKAIVLLTDGRQTVGGFGPGNSFGIGQADANTEQLCQSIKNDDILLITVAFDLNDTATRNRLRDCASASKYFFEAETNSDLVTTFKEITALFQEPIRLTR